MTWHELADATGQVMCKEEATLRTKPKCMSASHPDAYRYTVTIDGRRLDQCVYADRWNGFAVVLSRGVARGDNGGPMVPSIVRGAIDFVAVAQVQGAA